MEKELLKKTYMNVDSGLVYECYVRDYASDYYYSVNGQRESYKLIEKEESLPKSWMAIDNSNYWAVSKLDRQAYIKAIKIEKMAKKHSDWYCDDVLEITEAVKGAYLAGELSVSAWNLWHAVKNGDE